MTLGAKLEPYVQHCIKAGQIMLDNLIPAAIMFLITACFATLFFVPIVKFKQKHELVKFYWIGFWLFIVALAAFSGGVQSLMLMGMDTTVFGTAVLFSLTLCFPIFVMFAWFRLVGLALLTGAKKVKQKF